MPAAKHNHSVAVDPIPNEIWTNNRQLPMSLADRAASFSVFL